MSFGCDIFIFAIVLCTFDKLIRHESPHDHQSKHVIPSNENSYLNQTACHKHMTKLQLMDAVNGWAGAIGRAGARTSIRGSWSRLPFPHSEAEPIHCSLFSALFCVLRCLVMVLWCQQTRWCLSPHRSRVTDLHPELCIRQTLLDTLRFLLVLIDTNFRANAKPKIQQLGSCHA
jgi:hypothetical protein